MKKITPILTMYLFVVLTLTNCQKLDVPKDTPSCVKKEIKKIKSKSVRNPPAVVWQYEYNDKIVYYIPSYCCDAQSQLFDSECNQICSPDGGITGKGDGKCADFFAKRKNELLIWKDDR